MRRECLGFYGEEQGECDVCPLALFCIDIAIESDRHYDELAARQQEIEAMEGDESWTESMGARFPIAANL